MPLSQIVKNVLKNGAVRTGAEFEAMKQAVQALEEQEANQRAYEAWCEEQEQTSAMARELCSYPELLEECPW
jgi:hypothetical protein